VKRTYPKILRQRKRRIQRRLDPKRAWRNQPAPIMTARNLHYEMAQKSRAVNCAGLGAIHLMVNKLGLPAEIDARLHLLKRHLPYHEGDHVFPWLTTRSWKEYASRTSSCGATMKPSSTAWAPSAFPIRPRAEISPAAFVRAISSI